MLFGLAVNATAWKTLQDPQANGNLTADGVLHLCRAAGYTEKASQEAARARANQQLDAKQSAQQTVYVHQ